MKIAIAVVEKSENSPVSQRAGRAPYFLLFDGKGSLLEMLSNPFALGGGGAGFAVAKLLADKGVEVFIAGKIGENMKAALEEKGIRFFEKSGEAGKAAREVK